MSPQSREKLPARLEVAPDNRSAIGKLFNNKFTRGVLKTAFVLTALGAGAIGLGHLAHMGNWVNRLHGALPTGAAGALESTSNILNIGAQRLSFAGQNFVNFARNGLRAEGMQGPLTNTGVEHVPGTIVPGSGSVLMN